MPNYWKGTTFASMNENISVVVISLLFCWICLKYRHLRKLPYLDELKEKFPAVIADKQKVPAEDCLKFNADVAVLSTLDTIQNP